MDGLFDQREREVADRVRADHVGMLVAVGQLLDAVGTTTLPVSTF